MGPKIVTLTMNPAVDVCAAVGRIIPAHKLRCELVRRDAGGGGINVARVIRRFGGDPIAIFPAGGPIGQLLEHLVSVEGVAHATIPIRGDTREDFTVDEVESGAQFRFVLPGPELSEVEQAGCLDALASRLSATAYLIASGSLPPGVPDDFYARVAAAASARGANFVLDSSGASLRSALGPGVYLIKPSLREFEDLVGARLPNDTQRIEAARGLISEGKCSFVALSLGEQGGLLIGAGTAFRATAPSVSAVSTVGAGDSFLGALIWALSRNQSMADALKQAVAAGSAAMLSKGTGLCQAADCARLKESITVASI